MNAGPMDTCDAQAKCITFSAPELLSSGPCTGTECQWKVCLTLTLGVNGCVKDAADTVSHTCEFPSDTCSSGLLAFKGVSNEVDGIANGYTECQTGAGGSNLYFLLKDGQTCEGSTGVWPPDSTTETAKATCLPNDFTTASNEISCTGNPSGKECIWTYPLPPCPPPTPTPTPSPSCPNGPGVCYTTDCACVFGKCTPKVGTDWRSVLQGYTGADGKYYLKSICQNGKALSNAVEISDQICVKEDILVSGQGTSTLQVEVKNGQLVTPFEMKCGTECFIYDAPGNPFPYTCNPLTASGLAIATTSGSSVAGTVGIVAAVAMVGLIIGVFVYKKRIGKSATSENNHDVDTVVEVLTPRRSGDDN
jgi:hypothetical protein